MITVMHKRQDKIENKIVQLSTNFSNCNIKLVGQAENIKGLKKVVDELKDNLLSLITERIVTMLEDKAEEEKREDNLICFNIPEIIAEEDASFIKELLTESWGLGETCDTIDSMQRSGAKPKDVNSRHRLLKHFESLQAEEC